MDLSDKHKHASYKDVEAHTSDELNLCGLYDSRSTKENSDVDKNKYSLIDASTDPNVSAEFRTSEITQEGFTVEEIRETQRYYMDAVRKITTSKDGFKPTQLHPIFENSFEQSELGASSLGHDRPFANISTR